MKLPDGGEGWGFTNKSEGCSAPGPGTSCSPARSDRVRCFISVTTQPIFSPEGRDCDFRFNGESLLVLVIVGIFGGRDVSRWFPLNLGEGPGRRPHEQVLVAYLWPR